MNEKQALEYVDSWKQYGSVLGLTTMTELCSRLGNPQNDLRFVHIAGTNGKGSVLAYVSSVLKTAGYKVGKYISPVIFEYRERIQVNERAITKKAMCECLDRIKEACDSMVRDGLPHPTAFEAETAMAFLYFKKAACDIVILETGLGGRLDATNVIPPAAVTVIASVSMDHMAVLGKTLTEIAGEKAGIIKENSPVVVMEQAEEVLKVCRQKAEQVHTSLITADAGKASHVRYGIERQQFDYDGLKNLEIIMPGKCQIDNCVLAIETLKMLQKAGFVISEQQLRKGLSQTRWTGRFSVIGHKPLFVVDGAHNEDAARKLADSIRFYFTNKKIVYIMGILKDKEYEKIVAETAAYGEQIITITPPDNERALSGYELAKTVMEYNPHVTTADSLEEAVEMAYLLADKNAVILAFGSLSYLGRLIRIVEKRKVTGKGSHGR